MGYIKEEDIIKNNIKLSKAPINLDKYDMYYIKFQMKTGNIKTVRVFCEKGTFPEFESEKFENLLRIYGKKIIVNFFVKRLINNGGLMDKEGRDDYIYLGGELCKNGLLANRYMIQANGKTGQQNFDDELFNLKLKVEAEESALKNIQISKEKDNKGKTYVIADVHGMYGSYIEIIKKLKRNDHLIILGDVIDRGTGGIKIIQDIMERIKDRQHNPEITFLLGNHEMQFIYTIAIMKRRGLNREDLINIMNYKTANSHNIQSDEVDKYNEKYQELITKKKITNFELYLIEIWLNQNDGNTTIFDFVEGGQVNNVQEQNEIFKFLCNSYVVLPKKINGKNYLFVHSMPPKDSKMINNMKQTEKGYTFMELTKEQYSFMLQERNKSTYEQAKELGFITICGHTPLIGSILKDERKGFIRIDAGCGHKQRKSKLALYCVDDESVEYYDEKESSQEILEL